MGSHSPSSYTYLHTKSTITESQNCRTLGWRDLKDHLLQPTQKPELRRPLHLDLQQEEGANLLWDALKKASLFFHHLKSSAQWQAVLLAQNSSQLLIHKAGKPAWESRQCFHWPGGHQSFAWQGGYKTSWFHIWVLVFLTFPCCWKASSIGWILSLWVPAFISYVKSWQTPLPSLGIPGDVRTIPMELSPPGNSKAKQSFVWINHLSEGISFFSLGRVNRTQQRALAMAFGSRKTLLRQRHNNQFRACL